MHAGLAAWLWYGRGWLAYPLFLAVSVLACLVHQRILSEWFHEATHWNLVPSRDWNDRLSDLLLGTFNGTRVKSNRPGHFRHHAASEFFTPEDPDTRGCAAATRSDLLRGLLKDLSGASALQAFLATARGETGGNTASTPGAGWFAWLALLHGAAFAVTLRTGRPDIYPLYFLTQLMLYPIANRFRLYAHHARDAGRQRYQLIGSPVSRNFQGTALDLILLQSPMIMYHRAHHEMPALPYRALRALAPRATDPNAFGESGLRVAAAVAGGLPR
jgi:fatty acid desaturase